MTIDRSESTISVTLSRDEFLRNRRTFPELPPLDEGWKWMTHDGFEWCSMPDGFWKAEAYRELVLG